MGGSREGGQESIRLLIVEIDSDTSGCGDFVSNIGVFWLTAI